VAVAHRLLEPSVKAAIESAASRHLGRRWVSHAFTDLNDRASHPCGVLHGEPFSVFAKLDIGDNAVELFQAELSGLTLLRDRARVAIPTPIGTGLLQLDHGSLLLTEALSERAPKDRTAEDWRAIGHTLATLHQVHSGRFGLEDFNGFFGPLPQDNKPVTAERWVDFYSERRVCSAPQIRR
jgi:fructosamine-3-kinase